MNAPKATSTSKTFSIRTLTWERRKKLKQNTDVVITLGPMPRDGDSVMSDLKAIPWKILSFPANSDTCRMVTIHPKIAVSTVKEKENFVLTPQISEILMEGTETILKFMQKGGLQWTSVLPPKIIHGSNASLTVERTEPTQTRLISDDLVIKNEYEDTRLALCLVDHDDTRLPIVDLGTLPKDQTFTINGPLCVQAYAMAEQTVGKPMESSNCAVALFPWPIAVADLPETAFILYTQQNGLTRLEEPF
jgi:hypothetical protein